MREGTDGGTQPPWREHDAQLKVAAQDRFRECPIHSAVHPVSALLRWAGVGTDLCAASSLKSIVAPFAVRMTLQQPHSVSRLYANTQVQGGAYWGLSAGWDSARARKSGGDWYGLRGCIAASPVLGSGGLRVLVSAMIRYVCGRCIHQCMLLLCSAGEMDVQGK